MSLGGGGAGGAGATYRPWTPTSRSAFDPYWNRMRTDYAKRTGKAWPGPNPPNGTEPRGEKDVESVTTRTLKGGVGAPGKKSLTGTTLSFAGT